MSCSEGQDRKRRGLSYKPKALADVRPIVPEVCDRLGCRIESCYGWDLCRQARAECTNEEWDKLWAELFKEDEEMSRFKDRMRPRSVHAPSDPEAVADYALWRDAHGGGAAAATVLAVGRAALKRLRENPRSSEIVGLWRDVMNAVEVEERLDRAKTEWRLRHAL